MTFTIEDGSGVALANAFMTEAEVTAYLADRGRDTENSWDTLSASAQQAAIIAATDFIDRRFGRRFKGARCFVNLNVARTVLTFTGQPADGDTVTMGSTTITFRTVVTVADEVLIGANTNETIANLIEEAGNNDEVFVSQFFGDAMLVSATVTGTAGNGIATTEAGSTTSFSFATTRGGNDTNAGQPLSFPRLNLFDFDGQRVVGVPDKLKQATAEYAVRAGAAKLQLDPTIDASGRIVTGTKIKVGPIETATEFLPSGEIAITSYPAADGLLQEYLNPAGGTFR